MRIYVFENCDPTGYRFINGYRPEHPLRLAYESEEDRAGRSDGTICEELFMLLNRDDRPNGKVAASMSVGDVVTIEDEEGTRSYRCAGDGFDRLSTARVPIPTASGRLARDLREAAESGQIVRGETGNEATDA